MYYIYDANNELFGNPAGYSTYAIAWRIASRYRHKLWAIYDRRVNKSSSMIYNIEYFERRTFS